MSKRTWERVVLGVSTPSPPRESLVFPVPGSPVLTGRPRQGPLSSHLIWGSKKNMGSKTEGLGFKAQVWYSLTS